MEEDLYFELTSEINRLELENQSLKRNCNIGNEDLTFYREEYTKLKDKINKAIEYIEVEGEHTDCSGEPIYYLDEEQEEELCEYAEIIDKAINFIKEHAYYEDEIFLCDKEVINLLEILKGGNE